MFGMDSKAGWTFVLVMGGMLAGSSCAVEDQGEEPDDRDAPGLQPRDAELPLSAPPKVMKVPAPLPAAHCQVQVEGQGLLDLEEDYLPHVIQCENGGANLEALKAQAISARSVAYYNMETAGSICDSQGCQVYSCGADPLPIHYQAVEETSGVYLMYNNTLTYGFYVAGDNGTSPPACVGVSGSTEGYVTYNEGQTGSGVEQTTLGFIHDPADFGYGQNRGCMSQWGARCLENDNGYDHLGILRFYYGDDIQTVQAAGACVLPLPGEEGSSSGEPGDGTTGGGPTTGDPGVDASTGVDPDGPQPPLDTGDPTFPGGTAGDSTDPPDDSEGEGEGGATAGGLDPALPTTFGANDETGGCAIGGAPSSGGSGGPPWWLLVALASLGRRAARRRRP